MNNWPLPNHNWPLPNQEEDMNEPSSFNSSVKKTVDLWINENKLEIFRDVLYSLGYNADLNAIIYADEKAVINILKAIKPICKKPYYNKFIRTLVKVRKDGVSKDEWKKLVPF